MLTAWTRRLLLTNAACPLAMLCVGAGGGCTRDTVIEVRNAETGALVPYAHLSVLTETLVPLGSCGGLGGDYQWSDADKGGRLSIPLGGLPGARRLSISAPTDAADRDGRYPAHIEWYAGDTSVLDQGREEAERRRKEPSAERRDAADVVLLLMPPPGYRPVPPRLTTVRWVASIVATHPVEISELVACGAVSESTVAGKDGRGAQHTFRLASGERCTLAELSNGWVYRLLEPRTEDVEQPMRKLRDP